MRNNRIGPEGAAAISNMLKSNSCLQRLDLRWNEIGPIGARNLVSGLQRNQALKSLEIAGNKVPEDITALIEEALNLKQETSKRASSPV